ncbi:hypothetical protein HL670_03048 [Serratia plymuthica]|uniref:hypothetical protein n=1 Tax=Serratia plymuthica TaxID=82996 RepID=UPI00148DBADA|nr:hypothetical protein [Serratia plymuthica]QJW56159.1 hypothetical protein HL670_03048 [Serratia plymuthica]
MKEYNSSSITIPPDSEEVAYFIQKINSKQKPISVPCSEHKKPLGNCYWNVLSVIEKEGGNIVYGWLITLWPRSHVSAMHHAIWESPSGELFDVTCKLPDDPVVNVTTFLPDDSHKVDLDTLPLITSINCLLPLVSPLIKQITNDFIKAYQHKLHYERAYAEQMERLVGSIKESNIKLANTGIDSPLKPKSEPTNEDAFLFNHINHFKNSYEQLFKQQHSQLKIVTGLSN